MCRNYGKTMKKHSQTSSKETPTSNTCQVRKWRRNGLPFFLKSGIIYIISQKGGSDNGISANHEGKDSVSKAGRH